MVKILSLVNWRSLALRVAALAAGELVRVITNKQEVVDTAQKVVDMHAQADKDARQPATETLP